MKKTILLLNLVLAVTTAPAQTALQTWVQRYNGPGNGSDSANAIVVDGNGGVIVTGSSVGSGSSVDYATIKYSNAGLPLWTNRYNGPGNGDDHATTLAVDGNNNVIVSGTSNGSGSREDYATIKYSSDGVSLWTNRYNGPGNYEDISYTVAVDGSNNVIVTGASAGDLYDKTIKYSSDGVPLWTNSYIRNGAVVTTPLVYHRLAVDGSNNVVVTGYSLGSGSGFDFATIKYSGDGLPLWTNFYNGPGNDSDWPVAVAVDRSNNVIVTGGSTGSGSGNDYTTIKYSSAGVPVWTNIYNGPGNGPDFSEALAVDSSGNAFVTGYSTGSGSGVDFATIKYSSAGVPLWTNIYNGPGNGGDGAFALAVDGNNNVIVTGYSTNSGSGNDYTTIAYSSGGVPLWTNRYNGPGNGDDYANAMAVDRSGNVFVTGYSWNGTTYDYATIKYSVSPTPIPLNFQTLNNQLVLSWTNAAFGLQSAPASTGTFTNIADATSPYTNPFSGDQQYFRLISN